MDKYSVWVGGIEVNDYALTLEQATEWAEDYRKGNYDDVAIAKIEEDRKFRKWDGN